MKMVKNMAAGFWPGLLLSVFLFCAIWEGLSSPATMYHLLAMVAGMSAVILAEKLGEDYNGHIIFQKGKGDAAIERESQGFAYFVAWGFMGLGAGSQIAMGHQGALVLTAVSSAMLLHEAIVKWQRPSFLNILFISALLFFAGLLGGYMVKLYLPGMKSVFFSFSGGALIYFCCGKILPDQRTSPMVLIGTIVGFCAGLLLY